MEPDASFAYSYIDILILILNFFHNFKPYFLWSVLILSSRLSRNPPSSVLQVCRLQTCVYLSVSCVLHILRISSISMWSSWKYLARRTNYRCGHCKAFLKYHVTSSGLGPDVLVSTLFSKYWFFLKLKNISHPCKNKAYNFAQIFISAILHFN